MYMYSQSSYLITRMKTGQPASQPSWFNCTM